MNRSIGWPIQGVLLRPDREYEIESVYSNTTSEPVDAMAVMYLYHHLLIVVRLATATAGAQVTPTDDAANPPVKALDDERAFEPDFPAHTRV
ncbi:MAG: hypothetical protein IH849_11285 [Acidobacteria bacterium]|nr:hypothetical protein [Acidobacteriota bacterium]